MSNYKKKYTKDQIEEMLGELQEQLIEIKADEHDKQVLNKDTGITCEVCGGKYTRSNASIHRKTKKHINEAEHVKAMRRLIRSKGIDGRATR
ncbi:MAG TPA: hypothetical protein VK590_16225 [Saprospiraceae bacterium]|nr:hypothetical protein [Saprospiraceae bacterium]